MGNSTIAIAERDQNKTKTLSTAEMEANRFCQDAIVREEEDKKQTIATSSSPAEEEEEDDDAKSLFNNAMKGQWEEVVKTYKNCPKAKEAKITKAGDTVLHIAVSYGLTQTVLSMVQAIEDHTASSVLNIQNDRGNTPLHLAAQLGDVQMCESMVEKDKEKMLVAARNVENETPLFSSARYGKKDAFLYLKQQGSDNISLFRKKHGDTILHAAISGEYLDLAFRIINIFPELVNCVNENGQSPLHILASKPNLFKSGYRFLVLDYVIYPCILIDPLSMEKHKDEAFVQMSINGKTPKHPQNYQTCMNFIWILRTVFNMLRDIPRDLYLAMRKRKNRRIVGDQEDPQTKISSYQGLLPPNYAIIIQYFKLTMKALLIVLGLGIGRVHKVIEIKKRHTWANQVMHELVNRASSYKYESNGRKPPRYDPEILDRINSAEKHFKEDQNALDEDESLLLVAAKIGVSEMMCKILKSKTHLEAVVQELAFADTVAEAKTKTADTPILIAAKKGVVEVVAKILDVFPVAIQDLDSENKNVVLLAVENRQPHVYTLLLERKIMKDIAFRQVDSQGNSALHLAAMARSHRPWLIPGAALQMQWELKWYKFVKCSMPTHTFVTYNAKGQTAEDIFKDTHQELLKNGSEWLTKTSESYSFVAALIATVAFSTSSNIPGGVKEDSGTPNLKNQPAFNVFAISSVVALCFSVTALVFFLSILTSRFQEKNFAGDLPRKLLVGLTALFTSVASILVSFCAGHLYVLGDKVRDAAYTIYAATCFPVTFFVLAQLPLYFDLVTTIINKVPQHSYKDFPY